MSKVEMIRLLSEETTQFYMERGGIELKCSQASKHVVKLAKDAGITLVVQSGFYAGSQHNWAYSPEHNIIVDPTGAQFLGGRNGVITQLHPQWKHYLHVPEEWIMYLPHAQSKQYWAALSMKRWMDVGRPPIVERGEFKQEERIDKNGRPYVYKSFGTHMKTTAGVLYLRSMLVFPNRKGNGYTASAIFIKRVLKADGTEAYPTMFMRVVCRNGIFFWNSTDGKDVSKPKKAKLIYAVPEETNMQQAFFDVTREMSNVELFHGRHLGLPDITTREYLSYNDDNEPF